MDIFEGDFAAASAVSLRSGYIHFGGRLLGKAFVVDVNSTKSTWSVRVKSISRRAVSGFMEVVCLRASRLTVFNSAVPDVKSASRHFASKDPRLIAALKSATKLLRRGSCGLVLGITARFTEFFAGPFKLSRSVRGLFNVDYKPGPSNRGHFAISEISCRGSSLAV